MVLNKEMRKSLEEIDAKYREPISIDITSELPKALQLTDEQKEAKAYAVGTITIDKDGIWRVYYIGPHNVAGKKYFGNGVVALRNIRELFDVVGSRLNKVKEIYVDKILDLEKEKSDDTTPAKDTSST